MGKAIANFRGTVAPALTDAFQCGHCRGFAKDYAKAAEDLKNDGERGGDGLTETLH